MDVLLRELPVLHRGESRVLAALRGAASSVETDARRLELDAQARQAQKMEAIGHLTSGIAHDFNNILATVIGYLSMAQERAAAYPDPCLVRQIDQANLASRRAQDLIARMLDFARPQRSRRQLTSLSTLVEQTVQLLSATMPSSILLQAESAADMPLAYVDSVQIEQVLFNLCINARDAVASRGQISVRLQDRFSGGWHCASCGAEVPAQRWLEVSVADDGSGIADDVVDRMFEPFYSTKAVGKGSGMGLPMVHTILHDHGGHLLVDTAPGAGTTFRALLPQAAMTGPPADGRHQTGG
jgi:signal transduction histidine kinase